MCTSAHGSSEQAIGDLLRCLVQKRIVCFVFALVHGPTCCSHFLLVGGSILILRCHNPETVLLLLFVFMRDPYERQPFRGLTTGGTEDLGGDFDLAGAAGRAARSVWRKRSKDGIITIPTAMARTVE